MRDRRSLFWIDRRARESSPGRSVQNFAAGTEA